MTKAELIKALEPFQDDDVIALWEWTGSTSKFHEIEMTLQNKERNDYNLIRTGENKGKHFSAITINHFLPCIK